MLTPHRSFHRIRFWWLVLWGCLLTGGWLLWCDGSMSGRLWANDESPTKAEAPVEAAAPSEEDVQFFEARVRPLLVRRCGECHATAADEGDAKEGAADKPIPAKGGLRLDSSEALRKGGDSGPAVVPGDPGASLLIEAIAYDLGGLQMPPSGRLADDERQTLIEWVQRGAVHTGRGKGSRRPSGIDWERGHTWWAFQPWQNATPPGPQTSGEGWARVRSDAWIEGARQRAGVAANAEADRRTLLRRVAYGLTGLPPTMEEVAAFAGDDAPGAYERQVERLLASPAYGERWARIWLDLVRYADVLEMWAEDKQAGAWRYRDWVVRALNEDLGYDEFLERQLAADLRPDLPVTELAALGFLGLSPSYWKELKLSPAVIETVVADEWEERITALTGTVLGLTVACARCHDHKQDPISQEDYYAVAGMLASTRLRPRPLLSEGETRLVRSVRDQLAELSRERDRQQAIKPPTVESQAAVDELNARIAALEGATPQLAAPLVYGVEEAHIAVLPDGPDRTQVVYRDGQAIDVAVQVRGNPAQRGRVVPRGFPQVLDVAAKGRGDADQESAKGRPQQPTRGAEVGEQRVDAHRGGFREGSGRLEWARRCRTTAAPLVSRVFVNRVWKQHFGVGLVETPSNFGAGGELPSHPELLDDLARGFVASGWSVKWLQRQIVLSAAYRQASARNDVGVRQDPGNRLLWRSSRRRLDIEGWRDSLLLAAGRLSRQVGGPDRPLDDSAHNRRTVYGTVRRRDLAAVLRLFDAPDATQHVSHRESTITPLQTLFAFNSPLMQDVATEFARRIVAVAPSDPVAQLQWAWREAYQREPTEAEQRAVVEFLQQSGTDQVLARWQELAQVVLMSNEFTFVD